MSEPAIETRGLTRRFGRKAAIDDVNLTLAPGGIVALVGPTGAGKTTLLGLLAGLLEPSGGTAQILGHSARALPTDVAAALQTVGDRHEPPVWMRLADLLALQVAAAPKFDSQMAQQMLLDHRLSLATCFGTLSKGQRRWVLATLALASRPRVLLMDEPADGLDPAARRALYDLLRRYVNDETATVLVASHVLGDLERVADEVVVVRSGHVVLHESLETLRDETRELTLSGGEPSPAWLAHFQIISEKSDGQSRQTWIRLAAGAPANTLAEADRHPAVARVNLESLYFALTQAAPPLDGLAHPLSEAVPCN
jgi:ABC-2 type transport system ATP-binding protein